MAVLLGSIKSAKNRYYVEQSYYFNFFEYNINKISKILKENGAKDIRVAKLYGYSNLPKVVTFDLGNASVSKLEKDIKDSLNAERISIRKKDW